jgi:D-alanyl-D-alanine carboxypeptidase
LHSLAKKLILYILIAVGFISLLPVFASANTNQGASACAFEYLEFEDYLAVISAIAETVEYPHFFIENEHRYEEYHSNNPDMPFDVMIALVNVNIDKGAYTDVYPVADPDEISVLVNKHFELPPDWSPDDFTDIGGGHLMREEAAAAFILLREAMGEAGLNLTVVITHRSYATQRNHFNNAVNRLGLASAEGGFARPGHSEHQTGLAIDVLHRAHDGGLMMNMGFENSRQFDWLVDNAHDFGFILRYPSGYRSLSGFIFEPWHWRYVGIPIATAMYNEAIALYEEFYGRYLVQGMRDKVNAYLIEQQELAEAAAAAELEAAEAAAVELAAEEAAALAAAQAAELEAAELAEAEIAAAQEAEKAAAEAAAEPAAVTVPFYENRHFLEIIPLFSIVAAVALSQILKKKRLKQVPHEDADQDKVDQ